VKSTFSPDAWRRIDFWVGAGSRENKSGRERKVLYVDMLYRIPYNKIW